MKKIFIALTIMTSLIAACAKKSTPTVSKKIEEEPTATALGKSIYETNCGRCHALPPANKFTVQKWTSVVDWMAPKAKLTDQQKAEVLAYVHAHARK